MIRKKNIKTAVKHINLGQRTRLVENLLIIEGISRAGKFLLSNILHGFSAIEPVQYYGLLEHVPYLEKFGLIETETAKEILHCEIDSHSYEMLIGRNFNLRRGDKSSIYNNPNYKEYLKRCEQGDGDLAVAKNSKEKLLSSFILHEVMPNIKIFFDAFPGLRVISVQRSPLCLVYSWYHRGLGRRFGADPKLFSLPLSAGGKNVPWFTAGWEKEYLSLSEMDRIIATIDWIMSASRKEFYSLTKKQRDKILFVSYESILTATSDVICGIEEFLGKSVLKSEMKIILNREKLPNLAYSKSKKTKMDFIRGLSSPEYFKRLSDLEEMYNKLEDGI